MSLYEPRKTREELLKELDAEVLEETNDDGETVYRFANKDFETLQAKFEAEAKNSQTQRKKKQELEAELKTLRQERDKATEAFEKLKELNPEDMRKTIQNYVDEVGGYKSKIDDLETELEPLRKEVAGYKNRDLRARIEEHLVDVAKKFDCCDSALRDVKRLAPQFHFDEAGYIRDENGRLAVETIKAEIAASPHWLKRSQGGGSDPGRDAILSGGARYRDALQKGDFQGAIGSAPRDKIK